MILNYKIKRKNLLEVIFIILNIDTLTINLLNFKVKIFINTLKHNFIMKHVKYVFKKKIKNLFVQFVSIIFV